MLDRQIAAVEKAFVEGGGYIEQLAAARLAARQRRQHDQSGQSTPSDRIPPYPQCGKPMVVRTAKKGWNEGKQFWGCSGYPDCKGTLEN
ncbi:MAG: topoisomerase DNA-binding C4 zinc finger domain-containing protein [Verrucomicrobiales bacterium]